MTSGLAAKPLWFWAAPVLFLVGCILAGTSDGSASAGSAVRVSNASLAVGAASDTTVSGVIAATDTANAFDVTITFDPAIVSATAVTLGSGWISPPLVATIDNTAGVVRVAAFQLGAGCLGGPNCPLFSVRLLGLKPGTTVLHLASAQLAGSEGGVGGGLTAVATVDGTVSVSGNALTPTPTASPKSHGNGTLRVKPTRTPKR